VIAHAFEWGAVLGRVDLRLLRVSPTRWQLAGYWGRPLPVTSSTPEDPVVARTVRFYWKPIASIYGRRIGVAAADFAQKGHDHAEYNLVADAVREATGQQIAFENVGGVRAPLMRGPITYGDVVTMDPFNNSVVSMQLTGAEIRTLLIARRPAVSGIRYVIHAGRLLQATVQGKPLDDAALYSCATNSYFARDELFSRARNRTELQMTRLEAIIRYISERGTVKPAYDNRRVVRAMPDDY